MRIQILTVLATCCIVGCGESTSVVPPDHQGDKSGDSTDSGLPTDVNSDGGENTGGTPDGGTVSGNDSGSTGVKDGGSTSGGDSGNCNCSDGEACQTGVCVPVDPCAGVTCPEGKVCKDGTCSCDGQPPPDAGQCSEWKTLMCHYPPGNPSNDHNICVGNAAVPAHLAHGDKLGVCK